MWQRLTISMVDDLIRDLKQAVWDAKGSPAGNGVMVSLYGACRKRMDDGAGSETSLFGLELSSCSPLRSLSLARS